MKKIWLKGKQCRDDGYPVCKEPTTTDLTGMNSHIKVSTMLMTWHTAWNGEKVRRKEAVWKESRKIEFRLTVFPPYREEWKTTIIFAFPQGKSMFDTTSEQRDLHRDVSLSLTENLISSTGPEPVKREKNKTPHLFRAAYIFLFVGLHKQVPHTHGNQLCLQHKDWMRRLDHCYR